MILYLHRQILKYYCLMFNYGDNHIEPELINISIKELEENLRARTEPVMEVDLIKSLLGNVRLTGDNEFVFRIHFSLYHALYELKKRLGPEGYYFHLDMMRIRMVKVPDEAACSHYFPGTGNFCGRRSYADGRCSYHDEEYKRLKNSVSFDIMKDFYENSENISFGRSDLLKKLMNGVVIYAFRKGQLEAAMNFFGLTHPNNRLIKKKYRELAQRYHPDRNSGNDSMMKTLNCHYQILREVFIL